MGESAPHRPGHPSAVGTPDRPVDRRCRCRRPHRRLLPLPLRRPGGPYLCGSGCPWPGLARQRTRVRRPLEALHHHSPRTVDPHRAHPGSGRTPCTGVRPRLTPSAATTPTTPWTPCSSTPRCATTPSVPASTTSPFPCWVSTTSSPPSRKYAPRWWNCPAASTCGGQRERSVRCLRRSRWRREVHHREAPARATVEDEHQQVVPGAVRCHPVHAQQRHAVQGQAEFLV